MRKPKVKNREVIPERTVKLLRAMNPRQAAYIRAICNDTLIIADGPAGTGKTYIATIKALDLLQSGVVSQIILTRPAVPAGEKLGFLPGTIAEKYEPYIRPYMKALKERLSPDVLKQMLEDGRIVAEPISFIQGLTFDNAVLLVDEAENLDIQQFKLLLTRLGEGAKAIFMGDLDQSYINNSGFDLAIDILYRITTVITFEIQDVVRSKICRQVLEAFASYEENHGRLRQPKQGAR